MSNTINKSKFLSQENNNNNSKNAKNINNEYAKGTSYNNNKLLRYRNDDDMHLKSNQNLYNSNMEYNNSVTYLTNSVNNANNNPINPFTWDQYEDSKLCSLVYQYGTGNWELIAQHLNSNKSPIQCLHRWNSIMKPNYVKGPWNVEEDKKLIDWIKTNGASNWSACSEFIPGRTGKQCRERWMNALNPLLKKGSWEPEEDYIIFKLFKKLGSKWSTISNYIAGRTENSIKNRFYSTLRRIASETRKNEKNNQNDEKENNKNDQKLSLSNLMEYFNIAYIEKTKYIDSLIENLKLSENEILNSSVLKEILTMNNQKEFNNLNTTNANNNNENFESPVDKKISGEENRHNEENYTIYSNNKNLLFSPSHVNLLSRKRQNISNDNQNNNYNNDKIINAIEEYHNIYNNKEGLSNIKPSIKNNNYNISTGIGSLKQELEDQEAETVKKNLIGQNINSNANNICNNLNDNNLQAKTFNNNNRPENISYIDKNQSKINEYKSMSLDALANKIDSFCQLTQNFNSSLPLGNDNHTNKSNMYDNNNIASNLSLIKNTTNNNNSQKNVSVNADKIAELLNQLNDLENFLQVTKNELSKIENKNNDFSYADQLKNNLNEYEMPLNSCKVIDKDNK